MPGVFPHQEEEGVTERILFKQGEKLFTLNKVHFCVSTFPDIHGDTVTMRAFSKKYWKCSEIC